MFKVNNYFAGKVASIAFQTETLPATLGVMATGEYEFDTTHKETFTIVSGALTVRLPGSEEWNTYTINQQFIVESGIKFQVKALNNTAYLCTYG
jgi:uncharacterized protein YaiE (UPF0345 family)